jgi:hypothetical protein
VKIPDGIPFEGLLGGLVAADFGQARDTVALQATMQGRAAQLLGTSLRDTLSANECGMVG